MKKTYENAKIDIIEFASDVITASGDTPDVSGFGFDVPYDTF